jgi:hypothetical protein
MQTYAHLSVGPQEWYGAPAAIAWRKAASELASKLGGMGRSVNLKYLPSAYSRPRQRLGLNLSMCAATLYLST